MQSNIKKNLGLQTIYQIIATCLPLITSPYLSRVLGANQLGVFSYTTSIISYFTLFAMLGTVNYGTRSIASCGTDKDQRSYKFWSIYLLQVLVTTICVVLYILYLLFVVKDNVLISVIQFISLLSCLLDITWLFFGLELFKVTVTRNLVVRLLSLALILCCVKNSEDLWIYTLITVGSTLLSQLILWINVPKVITWKRVKFHDIIANFKPNLWLFIPLLAMSVYHTMDKTMLGILSDYSQSGFYYNADKIINVSVGVISGVSTVMLPRMTALISSGKKRESDYLFKVSLEGTVLAGVAIACGIAAIANEFEPFFFGSGYDDCINLTIVLAPVLIIKAFSFTARFQYLVPNHKEHDYTMSVVAGAGVNLILNWMIIPKFGAMGAVIATLLAELTACIWQFVSVNRYIKINKTILNCLIYFIFGIFMFLIVRLTAQITIPHVFLKICLEVVVGALAYVLFCVVYWKMTSNSMATVLFGKIFGTNKK